MALPYMLQGFPTIKWMWMDGDKVKSSDYNGGRTAKDIINFAFDKAKVSCAPVSHIDIVKLAVGF